MIRNGAHEHLVSTKDINAPLANCTIHHRIRSQDVVNCSELAWCCGKQFVCQTRGCWFESRRLHTNIFSARSEKINLCATLNVRNGSERKWNALVKWFIVASLDITNLFWCCKLHSKQKKCYMWKNELKAEEFSVSQFSSTNYTVKFIRNSVKLNSKRKEKR